MKKLPFKVSAKTARLFGRENVSNAEGAIAELIKNTYDADASLCLVCFLPRYSHVPKTLTNTEHRWLQETDETTSVFYEKSANGFQLRSTIDDDEMEAAFLLTNKLIDLWIIDNGSGMSASTIEKHWMVIGTNYKEKNIYSDKGRARTGAKGIGRFALDRLGNSCDLRSTSAHEDKNDSILWSVDWSLFDSSDKVLDDITAELSVNEEPLSKIVTVLDQYPTLKDEVSKTLQVEQDWETGTAIRIGLLRDNWSRNDLDHLNKSLGALIPPTEQKELNLFLFDASEPSFYGHVSPTVLDDYDYQVDAEISEDGMVLFNIYRNELNHSNLDPALFELEDMKDAPFNLDSFLKKKLTYSKSMNELFPGAKPEFLKGIEELGGFRVNLLFFKKGTPSRKDLEIYPYRSFQPGQRKAWLEEFGGIKIYRDNFAVRPYGELGGRSFDWLTLGQRVAVNPVAASRRGWKVSPQNIAGTVSISRQRNAKLNDQSNREGIIENKHFSQFREIILRIIREFEDDRSHIHFNLNELHKKQNKNEAAKSEGATTADRVKKSPEDATPEDAKKLAKAFEAQQEEIRELRDEQTMLRSLATLGTVLVSFSHEMGQLQNTMGSRSAELADVLTSYISQDALIGVGGPFNPYTILDDWEEDDKKVKQWFTFALSSVRADKRRRKWIPLRDHLKKSKATWSGFLKPREVKLDISFMDDKFSPKILAYEIDLDSIFNNLILNSVEIFLSPKHKGMRKIDIDVTQKGEMVVIDYKDNGPGIDPSIKDPRNIFKFAVSTKLDNSGDATGTGLGLWILAAVVHTYGGSARAFAAPATGGFRMEIQLPIKSGEHSG